MVSRGDFGGGVRGYESVDAFGCCEVLAETKNVEARVLIEAKATLCLKPLWRGERCSAKPAGFGCREYSESHIDQIA